VHVVLQTKTKPTKGSVSHITSSEEENTRQKKRKKKKKKKEEKRKTTSWTRKQITSHHIHLIFVWSQKAKKKNTIEGSKQSSITTTHPY
jgi:hypothetical protein